MITRNSATRAYRCINVSFTLIIDMDTERYSMCITFALISIQNCVEMSLDVKSKYANMIIFDIECHRHKKDVAHMEHICFGFRRNKRIIA